jgi:hypothetical protein
MSNKPRRSRTIITQQFMEKIVRDHIDLNMTFLQIAHKYSCCFQTVMNICSKNEYGFWNKPAGLAKGVKHKPKPLVSDIRKHLTIEERKQLILLDMIEILELLNQRIIERLEAVYCDVSSTQLATFFAIIAPFVISKKRDRKGKNKDKEIEPSDSEMYSMFKKQVEYEKEN